MRKPRHRRANLKLGSGRRPIDSRVLTRSPATLAGLTILSRGSQPLGSLTAGGVPPRRARVGDATKRKARWHLSQRALSSGDVLLSHGLSPYYHRGCSVSLPCSEWERVEPLR